MKFFNQDKVIKGEYPSANFTSSARSLGKIANMMANKG